MAMNIAICYGIAFSENTRRIVYHVKVNKIKNKMGSDSSIVDGLSTMVLANKSKTVKILSWYDNEWSFACRLIDLMKFVANMMHA